MGEQALWAILITQATAIIITFLKVRRKADNGRVRSAEERIEALEVNNRKLVALLEECESTKLGLDRDKLRLMDRVLDLEQRLS